MASQSQSHAPEALPREIWLRVEDEHEHEHHYNSNSNRGHAHDRGNSKMGISSARATGATELRDAAKSRMPQCSSSTATSSPSTSGSSSVGDALHASGRRKLRMKSKSGGSSSHAASKNGAASIYSRKSKSSKTANDRQSLRQKRLKQWAKSRSIFRKKDHGSFPKSPSAFPSHGHGHGYGNDDEQVDSDQIPLTTKLTRSSSSSSSPRRTAIQQRQQQQQQQRQLPPTRKHSKTTTTTTTKSKSQTTNKKKKKKGTVRKLVQSIQTRWKRKQRPSSPLANEHAEQHHAASSQQQDAKRYQPSSRVNTSINLIDQPRQDIIFHDAASHLAPSSASASSSCYFNDINNHHTNTNANFTNHEQQQHVNDVIMDPIHNQVEMTMEESERPLLVLDDERSDGFASHSTTSTSNHADDDAQKEDAWKQGTQPQQREQPQPQEQPKKKKASRRMFPLFKSSPQRAAKKADHLAAVVSDTKSKQDARSAAVITDQIQQEDTDAKATAAAKSTPLHAKTTITIIDNTNTNTEADKSKSKSKDGKKAIDEDEDSQHDQREENRRHKRDPAQLDKEIIGRVVVFDPTSEMLCDMGDEMSPSDLADDQPWGISYSKRRGQLRELQKTHQHHTSSLLSPPLRGGSVASSNGGSSIDELLRVDDDYVQNVLGSLPQQKRLATKFASALAQCKANKAAADTSPILGMVSADEEDDEDDDDFNSAFQSMHDLSVSDVLDNVPFYYPGKRWSQQKQQQQQPRKQGQHHRPDFMRSPDTATTSVTWIDPKNPSQPKQNQASRVYYAPSSNNQITQSPPRIIRKHNTPTQEIEIVFSSDDNNNGNGNSTKSLMDEDDDTFHTPKYDWFLPEHANVTAARRKPITVLTQRVLQTKNNNHNKSSKNKSLSLFPTNAADRKQMPARQAQFAGQGRYQNKFRPISPAPPTQTTSTPLHQPKIAPATFMSTSPSSSRFTTAVAETDLCSPRNHNSNNKNQDDDDFAFSIISDTASQSSDAVHDLLAFCASSTDEKSEGLFSLLRYAGFH